MLMKYSQKLLLTKLKKSIFEIINNDRKLKILIFDLRKNI